MRSSIVVFTGISLALAAGFSLAVAQERLSSGIQSGRSASSAPVNIAGSCEAAISQSIRDDALLETKIDGGPRIPRQDFRLGGIRPRENYFKMLEIARLSWPDKDGSGEIVAGRLSVGFRRPYYSLKKILQLAGSFDVKIDGQVMGLTNSTKLTVRYDFARPLKYNSTRMQFFMDNVTFKIGIPFTWPLKSHSHNHNSGQVHAIQFN